MSSKLTVFVMSTIRSTTINQLISKNATNSSTKLSRYKKGRRNDGDILKKYKRF